MLATLVGLIFVAGGLWGMVHWRQELLLVLKGLLPLCAFFGGVVALIVGIASMRSPSAAVERQHSSGSTKKQGS